MRLGWDAKQLGFKLKWTGPLPTTPKSADDGGDDNTADGAANSANNQPDRDCLIFVFPAQDRYTEEVFFRQVTMFTPLTYARLVKALDRALEVRAVLLGADSGRRKRRAAPKAKGKAKAKAAGEKREREESQPALPPPSMAAMEVGHSVSTEATIDAVCIFIDVCVCVCAGDDCGRQHHRAAGWLSEGVRACSAAPGDPHIHPSIHPSTQLTHFFCCAAGSVGQVTGTKKVLIERIKDQLPFIKGQGTHQKHHKTSAGSDESQSMPKADGQQGGWE